MLREEYKRVKHNFRVSMLTNFLISVGKGINKINITSGPSNVDPLPIKYFQPYFQKTFYSLYQILGFGPSSSMSMAHMYMATSIQHLNINTLYDFSTYIAEEIHKGLVALKGGKIGVIFWWFLLFMHMFLFKDANYFGQEMELKRVVDGIEISVQSWTPIG